MSRWVKFFKADDDAADEGLEVASNRARAIVDASESPFLQEILLWLDKESSKPLAIGAHADMVVVVTRLNVLREVRAHILTEVEKAKRTLEIVKGD